MPHRADLSVRVTLATSTFSTDLPIVTPRITDAINGLQMAGATQVSALGEVAGWRRDLHARKTGGKLGSFMGEVCGELLLVGPKSSLGVVDE